MTGAKMPHPKLRLYEPPADLTAVRDSQEQISRTTAKPRSKRALWLGFAGGWLSQLLGRRLPPVTGGDLKKQDYPTSTQRMGVRFTERIRDTFRFRWLRKTS
jgi:hypothetical protein